MCSGEEYTFSTPSSSRQTAVPTMSTIASTAPTSWKWIFSTGSPWTFDSASPARGNARRLRSRTRPASSAGLNDRFDVLQVPVRLLFLRCGYPPPARAIRLCASRGFPGGIRRVDSLRISSRKASGAMPQSSSAPSAILPLMPEKQSKQAIVVIAMDLFDRDGRRFPASPSSDFYSAPMITIFCLVSSITRVSRVILHSPSTFLAVTKTVPDPFGPDTAKERSALPDAPVSDTSPLTSHPASIGVPNSC